MTAIRLVVVDDHPLFREGVMRTLSALGFEIVGEGSTSDDAIALAHQYKPDVLLIDISMPGGGLETISPILSKDPKQKLVFLTVSEATEDAVRAINSGAKGYVLKGVGARSLADILISVAAGETYVAPILAARMLAGLRASSSSADIHEHPLATLTQLERQILDLVASGLTNKHVALELDIPEKTVKHHMTRLMSKLKVRNRTAAAMVFRNAGGSQRGT